MQINSLPNFAPFQHFNYHGVADNLDTFAGTIGLSEVSIEPMSGIFPLGKIAKKYIVIFTLYHYSIFPSTCACHILIVTSTTTN